MVCVESAHTEANVCIAGLSVWPWNDFLPFGFVFGPRVGQIDMLSMKKAVDYERTFSDITYARGTSHFVAWLGKEAVSGSRVKTEGGQGEWNGGGNRETVHKKLSNSHSLNLFPKIPSKAAHSDPWMGGTLG